jgi:hypothetical protein
VKEMRLDQARNKAAIQNAMAGGGKGKIIRSDALLRDWDLEEALMVLGTGEV